MNIRPTKFRAVAVEIEGDGELHAFRRQKSVRQTQRFMVEENFGLMEGTLEGWQKQFLSPAKEMPKLICSTHTCRSGCFNGDQTCSSTRDIVKLVTHTRPQLERQMLVMIYTNYLPFPMKIITSTTTSHPFCSSISIKMRCSSNLSHRFHEATSRNQHHLSDPTPWILL